MSESAGERWDLVFRGDIVIGHNLEDVKKRLMQLFKADAAKIEGLFSGRPVTLKRDMDRPTADKYQAVLQKAGAEVALVNAAKRREASAPRPRRAAPSPAPAGLSLAPAGGDLLGPDERPRQAPVAVDISGLSLRPVGELLEQSERARPAAQVAAPDFDVAEVGADLTDADERRELPLAEPDIGDWDIREAGEDLLSPEERPSVQTVSVRELEADLAPVGSELGQKPRDEAPQAPDTSHLTLED